MKKSSFSMLLKKLFGLCVFALFTMGSFGIAKAETVQDVNADTTVTTVAGTDNIELNAIMKSIEGRKIVDGESFVIDGYRFDCEVISNQSSGSEIAINSVSNDYTSVCNINVTSLQTLVNVATITHTVNITRYDSGLVHINSGSVSVTTHVSSWSGYAYGYHINNTDGSYSSAGGMVELYDSSAKLYSYYGASVSISKGGSPSFSFSQV